MVGDFEKYADAVDCVDALIRHDFPANNISIIGAGLRSVERVRARLGYGRMAFRGLIQGSWVGLIYWLFFGGSGSGANPSDAASVMQVAQQTLVPAIVIGAGAGMLYQVLKFSFSRKQREFLSMTNMVAANYEVVVPNVMFELAKQKLAEHQSQCQAGH